MNKHSEMSSGVQLCHGTAENQHFLGIVNL